VIGAFVGIATSAATALLQRPSVTAKATSTFFIGPERNTANLQWSIEDHSPEFGCHL
jgi:hypothetical protein